MGNGLSSTKKGVAGEAATEIDVSQQESVHYGLPQM